MIIVLEGPDCAGKSTLAQSLVAGGGSLVANGRPPTDRPLVDHYSAQIAAASAHPGLLTVFDRLHIGELIYGPLFRGSSALDAPQMESLEVLLDSAGATKIHVDCSDQSLIERYELRGDDLIPSAEVLLRNAKQYRDLLGTGGIFRGWQRIVTDSGGANLDVIQNLGVSDFVRRIEQLRADAD